MKNKLIFGAGIAAGYVLGSRSGRAAYEKLRARTAEFLNSKPVQDKVTAAAEAIKDKAPEVSAQLGEAARRAGTVLGSAVHRDPSHSAASGASAAATTVPVAPDVNSDPALTDREGQDWSDEGGATPAGPATSINPDKLT
jgi:hypothetical protein